MLWRDPLFSRGPPARHHGRPPDLPDAPGRRGPTQALSFGRSKAKIYDGKELKMTFADVAGIDEAKAELVEVVDFPKIRKKYQRLGGRIPSWGRA